MKCPKCGYNSFDYLQTCKKCGGDLTEQKARFQLRSLFPPPRPNEPPATPVQSAAPAAAPAPAAVAPPSRQPEAIVSALPPAPPPDHDPAELSLEDLIGDLSGRSDSGRADVGEDSAQDDFFSRGEPEEKEPVRMAVGFAASAAQRPHSPAAAPKEEWRPEPETESLDDLSLHMSNGHPEANDSVEPLSVRPEPAALSPPPAAPVVPEPAADDDLSIDLDDFDRCTGAVASPLGPAPLAPGGSGSCLPGLEGDFDLPAERSAEIPADPATVAAFPETEAPAGEDATPFATAAPLGRRIAAALTDTALLGLLYVLFLSAGEFALGGGRSLTTSLLDMAIPYFLVFFCLGFGYFTLFHFFVGQTVGKMLFRLRVTGSEGEPLLFSQAFLRSAGGLLSLLPAGIGYLVILTDRSRRGWNDRLAGSRVVCLEMAETAAEIADEFSGAGH